MIGLPKMIAPDDERSPVGSPARSPAPPPSGAVQPQPQAPIGHRQPNASDVPPSVLQSEGERTEQEKKFDKVQNPATLYGFPASA